MERAEVAIVGAGITGLSLAFFLASSGCDALVLERRGIGAEASGVQPGGVRQQWSTAVNCGLAREAAGFYSELEERLGRRVEAHLEPCGYLFVALGDDALARLRENVSFQNELGVPSRIVTPDEISELVTGFGTDGVAGGAWCGEDGYFDRPQTVVQAFADAALARGARLEIAEVGVLERHQGAWRLQTTKGQFVTQSVVVAAGCGAPALLETVGFAAPIVPEARHLFLSEPISERLVEPLVVVGERRFAAKHLANGRVLASDLAAAGDPNAKSDEWRSTVARGIADFLPILSYVSFPVLATGFYDLTPDNQPLVGAVPGHEGLWLAAGYSGHGFMLAPAISPRIAAAVLDGGGEPPIPEFALDRFAHDRLLVEQQVV